MQELYSESDVARLSGQLKKRYLLMAAVMAVILAMVVWSAVIRLEWLTIASVILLFGVMVFVIDLFCMPIHHYKKLLVTALTGRTHTGEYEFRELEPDPFVVDGVSCRGMIFLGDPDKHGTREQRFYWDDQIPIPPFREGDRITLKYSGRNIIGYQA